MDISTKIDIIKSLPTEEIITEIDLQNLLENKSSPIHYIGLEISGMPHIGHILVCGKKINDFNEIGAKTNILLADWHSFANNKLGGDWDRIIKASAIYKKIFEIYCPKSRVILGSELYKDNDDYWKNVMRIASKTTMARATRTLIIEGRNESDALHVSQYFYPIMQVADIIALDADIPHSGIDQRRVHMLAKEAFKDFKYKNIVPVHHHLLPSLKEPPKTTGKKEKDEIVAEMKMSKSKPGSSIPIIATDEEIKKIVSSAWCPERVTIQNPVLEICKYIIFPIKKSFHIERKKEYGGELDYISYDLLEKDFSEGKLHPADLKRATGEAICALTSPVRDAFKGKEDQIRALLS